jgi:hypothetical protein
MGQAIPERNDGGQIVGYVGTITDITDRKQNEARVAEQMAELNRWHDAMLGRERRVIEMKQEVNALLAQLGQPPRYDSVPDGVA